MYNFEHSPFATWAGAPEGKIGFGHGTKYPETTVDEFNALSRPLAEALCAGAMMVNPSRAPEKDFWKKWVISRPRQRLWRTVHGTNLYCKIDVFGRDVPGLFVKSGTFPAHLAGLQEDHTQGRIELKGYAPEEAARFGEASGAAASEDRSLQHASEVAQSGFAADAMDVDEAAGRLLDQARDGLAQEDAGAESASAAAAGPPLQEEQDKSNLVLRVRQLRGRRRVRGRS